MNQKAIAHSIPSSVIQSGDRLFSPLLPFSSRQRFSSHSSSAHMLIPYPLQWVVVADSSALVWRTPAQPTPRRMAASPKAVPPFAARSLPPSADIPLPANANIANAKDYGAKGDGITDDTKAIQRALNANRYLYLPRGTYLVSNTLTTDPKRIIIQGESQTETVIRLKDNAPGFTNVAVPKPLITTFEGTSTGQAFQNRIQNLTVDVGTGNAGAIGIRLTNNNQGGVEDVTIRSSDPGRRGRTGLALTKQWPGPGLIKNVTIEGFNFGIRVANPEYSYVFENIVLQHQLKAGIDNIANILSIRQLTSINQVPAIQNTGDDRSVVMVLDSNLTGGSSSESAIANQTGTLYARNITTSGYRSAISNGRTVIPGTRVQEYVSKNGSSLFSANPSSLNLPIQETPLADYGAASDWVSVSQFGANGNDQRDDTAAIQRALSSGKSTVYFPRGNYIVSDTLRVDDSVSVINGMYSTFNIADPLQSHARSVFRFQQSQNHTVTLEKFWGNYGGSRFYWVEHASAGTVVLRNFTVGSGKAYRNTGFGRLFVEDVSAGDWVFDRQSVWIRQINPENPTTKITNTGGTVWIMGLKTEKEGTVLETRNGGRTEILGGLIYPASGGNRIPKGQAAFINLDSQLSIAGVGESRSLTIGSYDEIVRETQKGIVKRLRPNDLPRRDQGFLIPLFR
ncbi:MAG: glycoside hydrolase family 55 protein [Oculatellaceae cyanobacterium Prado106]|nr:glycoside hydrolase family 55 protein [Oculatellaceae cyanobacterium Prado106]